MLSGNTISGNATGVNLTTATGTAVARSRGNNTFVHNATDVSGGSPTTLNPK